MAVLAVRCADDIIIRALHRREGIVWIQPYGVFFQCGQGQQWTSPAFKPWLALKWIAAKVRLCDGTSATLESSSCTEQGGIYEGHLAIAGRRYGASC
jgi:hypothetical protein